MLLLPINARSGMDYWYYGRKIDILPSWMLAQFQIFTTIEAKMFIGKEVTQLVTYTRC